MITAGCDCVLLACTRQCMFGVAHFVCCRVKLSFARPSVDAMKEGKESVTPSPNVCLGKNRYKTGGLTVILCLALWSLVSGGAGIAIRWSVGIYPFSGTLAENGLDALASIIMPEILGGHMPKNSEVRSLAAWELAARARIVRWVWETYLKDPSTRISDFWHDAFEAAFEELERGDERARDAAFEEIAKLTVNVFELDEKSEKPNVQILTAEADPLAAFPSWRVEH